MLLAMFGTSRQVRQSSSRKQVSVLSWLHTEPLSHCSQSMPWFGVAGGFVQLCTTLSPQNSFLQDLSQPSPDTALPSSHSSPGSGIPFPHKPACVPLQVLEQARSLFTLYTHFKVSMAAQSVSCVQILAEGSPPQRLTFVPGMRAHLRQSLSRRQS